MPLLAAIAHSYIWPSCDLVLEHDWSFYLQNLMSSSLALTTSSIKLSLAPVDCIIGPPREQFSGRTHVRTHGRTSRKHTSANTCQWRRHKNYTNSRLTDGDARAAVSGLRTPLRHWCLRVQRGRMRSLVSNQSPVAAARFKTCHGQSLRKSVVEVSEAEAPPDVYGQTRRSSGRIH